MAVAVSDPAGIRKEVLGPVKRILSAVPLLVRLTCTQLECVADSVAVSVVLSPGEIDVSEEDSLTVVCASAGTTGNTPRNRGARITKMRRRGSGV